MALGLKLFSRGDNVEEYLVELSKWLDATRNIDKLESGGFLDTASIASAYETKVDAAAHDHYGGDGGWITDAHLSTSNVTDNNVTTAKHGFCPIAPDDTAKFLRGDASWAAIDFSTVTVISSGGGAPSSTPSRIGLMYIDTTSSPRRVYISVNTVSSASWKLVSIS